jgi:O-antigen ligase
MQNQNLWKQILYGLLSFEMFFALFLFAGSYKADPRFSWFPIDITIFFFGLSIISGLYIFITKQKLKIKMIDLKFICLFGAFAGYALVSLIWTPSIVYAHEKAFFICTILAWSVVATTMIISSNLERLKRFLVICVLFGTWLSIEGFSVQVNKGEFINVLGGNYIGFSRILGLAAIVITYFLLFMSKNKMTKLFSVSLLFFIVWNMLNAGARGPLLAFIISLVPIIYYGWKLKERTIKIHLSIVYVSGTCFLAFMYFVYQYFANTLPTALLRLLVIFQEEGMGASAATRLAYYNQSLDYWKQNFLFGSGIGSWPILHNGVDVNNYPHNIFLEIGTELGLMGIVLFIVMHVYLIKALHGANKKFYSFSLMITSILIFYFINTLVSGDVNENRYYFAFLGISVFIVKNFNQRVTLPSQNSAKEAI